MGTGLLLDVYIASAAYEDIPNISSIRSEREDSLHTCSISHQHLHDLSKLQNATQEGSQTASAKPHRPQSPLQRSPRSAMTLPIHCANLTIRRKKQKTTASSSANSTRTR